MKKTPFRPSSPVDPSRCVPQLLTAKEVAETLRTSLAAIYTMIERRQLPGVTRIGRRVLIRQDALVDWLSQKSSPSLREM